MTPVEVLESLGLGVGANAVWAHITTLFGKPRESALVDLQSFLKIKGVTVTAPQMFDALASKGVLVISGSVIGAGVALNVGAAQGAEFHVGDSVLHNFGTGASVNTGSGGSISGSDGGLRLDANGNVVVDVGSRNVVANIGSSNMVINLGRKP
jgi:hypothetical protein